MTLVETKETALLAALHDLWRTQNIESTSATKVTYSGVLYNVDGSSGDPTIDKQSWKALLIENGIDGDCYVTSPLPSTTGTSHPGFDVGGHMTPNSDGKVATGGSCYLMPLCAWHNNKARDGQPFSHTETEMLQLEGYMEGEAAVSFRARMEDPLPYSAIFATPDGLRHMNLDAAAGRALQEGRSAEVLTPGASAHLLLHRTAPGRLKLMN